MLNLKPVTLQDKDLFDQYLREYPLLGSEYAFTDIFNWRNSKEYQFAVLENHLILTAKHEGKPYFMQPIGRNPVSVVRKIATIYPDQMFMRIEERVAKQLDSEFKVEHDPDRDDYLYSVKDLIDFPGKKYDGKRNFIKRFETYNPTVCSLTTERVKEFLDFQDRWCDSKDCGDDTYLSSENLAVKEMLMNFDSLDDFGICVVINGKIEGFAIGEPLNETTIVEHFEKGNTDFEGIYPYVLNSFAKAIPSKYTLLNREQDIGIEGLRKSKLSYHPVEMIKKYIITPKL
jgi:hypothetical protein